MKNKTFRFACFAPFDFQGVEKHLSAMAAKGWRLEKAGGSLWSYRRAEPARVRCAVTCPPEGEEETSDRLFFQDLCASASWEKAADWAGMQIYTSEREDPTPLETDPGLFLERVHRSMKSGYLRNHLGQMVFAAFWVLRTGLGSPRRFFLSNLSIGMFLSALLLLLLHGSCSAGYWFWYRRSLRSVEEGGDLAPLPGWFRALSRVYDLWIFLLLPPVLLELACGTPQSIRTGAWVLLGTLMAVGLALGLNRYLKGRTMSRENQAVLALVCVFVLALPFIEWDSYPGPALETPEPEADEYLWQGQVWDREPQEIPLTAEDLTGRTWPHVRRTARAEGRTLFASEIRYTEAAARADGTRAYLHYVITDIPSDRLCRAVLDEIRTGPSFLQYQSEDPGPWGAETAWRLEYPDGRTTGEWLVQWPGRIAAFRAEGLDLTPEQKTVIGARLAPEGRKEGTR